MADTVGDGPADDTTDCVVPLQVVHLPRTTESPLGYNRVEHESAGVVGPIWTSEVHLIGIVIVTHLSRPLSDWV